MVYIMSSRCSVPAIIISILSGFFIGFTFKESIEDFAYDLFGSVSLFLIVLFIGLFILSCVVEDITK